MSSRTMSAAPARASASPRSPFSAVCTSCRSRRSRLARLSRASALSSTIRTRGCRARRGRRRLGGAALGRAGRAHRRQADREGRCPGRGPRSSRRDRAAVQLDQAAHQRQADAEPAAARGRALRSPWTNRSKTRGSSSGGMPTPLSRTVEHAPSASGSHRDVDRAAGRRVLQGVVEQVGDDLLEPGRGRRRTQRSCRSMTTRWCADAIAARQVSITAATTARQVERLALAAGSCRR